MTNVVISDSVTSIGDGAFEGCDVLASVYCLGDAPAIGETLLFGGNEIAIVYYLPYTSGWAEMFGGRPTALWVPKIEAEGLGMEAGRFGFNMNWAPGKSVVVEACTNMADPNWVPLETNVLADGTGTFNDPDGSNHVGRFYRTIPAP